MDRIAGTCVGVRKLQTTTSASSSSILPHDGTKSNNKIATTTRSTIVYKTIDAVTGQERRMTTREKRKFRQEQRELQKKKRRKRQEDVDATADDDDNEDVDESQAAAGTDNNNSNNQDREGGEEGTEKRYQMEVDPAQLAAELEDLRGERVEEGGRIPLPPMVVPAPFAHLFLEQQQQQPSSSSSSSFLPNVTLDDDWASEWAETIKQNIMQGAEIIRKNEVGIRPLPYHLVPQVWKRMRPPSLGRQHQPMHQETVVSSTTTTSSPLPSTKLNNKEQERIESARTTNQKEWAFCTIRPNRSSAAGDDGRIAQAILQLLHMGSSSLHISCGAKFGCDYLLYDGPRNERHAFAGLRIVVDSRNNNTHMPSSSSSAYSLAGYVRCLNTAGKLALLATAEAVQQPEDGGGDDDIVEAYRQYRVAIVDLALEKTQESTSKRPTKTLDQRIKNLAKC